MIARGSTTGLARGRCCLNVRSIARVTTDGGYNMTSGCRVRLQSGSPWRRGIITTAFNPPAWFLPIVIVDSVAYNPDGVDTVYVPSCCQIELLDAAVEAGFYVLGQPREAVR